MNQGAVTKVLGLQSGVAYEAVLGTGGVCGGQGAPWPPLHRELWPEGRRETQGLLFIKGQRAFHGSEGVRS